MSTLRYLLVAIAVLFSAQASAFADGLADIQKAANAYRAEAIAATHGLDPQIADVRLVEAGQAAAKGRWAEAAGKLKDVLGLGREGAANWEQLSEYEEKAGSLRDAAFAAYLAYAAASGDLRGQELLRVAALLDNAGQTDEAIAAYDAALKITWDSQANDRLAQLRDAMAFRPVNSRLDLSGETPEACIEFKGELQDPGTVHYQDFVRIEPKVDASYSITDAATTLCISGLDFGTEYKVKLLPGFPSASGDKMAQGEDLDFAVGDRAPSIGFRDSAYVLPKVGSTGVPLITVNTDRVSLRLMRINDRKLVDQLVDRRFLVNLSGYDAEDVVDRSGELVWKGSMSVENQRNKRVVTAFPIQDVVKETKPGIYVLMASPWNGGRDADEDSGFRWNAQATQWLVVSDLGMTSLSGADGLTVAIRSLETGAPLEDVKLQLVARNNEVLATAASDGNGMAKFDPGLLRGEGGRQATAVMAQAKDGDFSFLDLTRAAFDLSDRGVGGRAMPGNADLFFYSDRGVYRPGETAHVMALLRDQGAKAIAGTPVMFRVLRPDGVEAARLTGIKDQGAGFQFDIPIAATARTGNWTVEAYLDPEGDPIADMTYLVEDVVPAQIETTVKPSVDALAPDGEATAAVSARFLYGAPAADLVVKSDVTIAVDDDPFPQLPGYRFGLADEKVDPVRTPFDDASTDAQGQATIDLALGELPDTAQPLAATLRVEVYEFGGRPVIKSVKLPIHDKPFSIGIKPLFDSDQAPSGAAAGFEVVAVDRNGKQVDHPGLSYRFVAEDWDYQWFYDHNAWDYDVVVRDKGISEGKLDASAAAPAKLSLNTDWGHYRLEVYDASTGVASSVRFYAGWWSQPGTTSTPDRMQVVSDKDLYQAGDDANVHLAAPFAGQAMVTVATDRVLETRLVDVPKDGTNIEVKVDPAWGAGAYVLVSAFRPGNSDEQHGPGRAVGLTWLAIDPKPRQLQVSMTVPDKVLPRGGVDIPISVSNLSGGAAYLTLAAVDEGILQLTDFKTPDPLGYYFGKRRLGLDIRDLYGQLIDGKEGKRGQIREGGDEAGLERRGAPPEIKLVALYSGLIRLDEAGKATVHLDIPDYNGRLRLMAVAYDERNVGAAETGLIVRDPVVVLSSTPRFLAPGDQSELSLSVQNLDAPAGTYHVALSASEAVQIADNASFDAELNAGAAMTKAVPVLGRNVGTGIITMQLTGPNGFALSREIKVPVRPSQTPMAQTLSRMLQPGESFTLSKKAMVPFLPETAQLQVSFSAKPNLDVPAVLRDLSHYPYGCLEQTTSIAFPLLYVRELSEVWGVKDDYTTTDRTAVQNAVSRAFEHERSDGMFGLWSASDAADKWLSAYAMDFLTEAKAQGYQLSEVGYRNGLKGLGLIVGSYNDDDAETLNARAYALYVLAKAKMASLSDLRYMADTYLDRLPTPIASAQLGAALALSGDMERAAKAFAKARLDAERAANGYWDYSSEYYGSGLRDTAALISLLVEAKMPNADVAPLLDSLAAQQSVRGYLSTQEEAWILRAAHATAGDRSQVKLAFSDGVSADQAKPYLVQAEFGAMGEDRTAVNKGDKPLFLKATASGVPAKAQPAAANGATVERKLYTLDGHPVDAGKISQNDIVVAVITGRFDDRTVHRAMVVDLLPAGLEIENQRLNNTRRTGDLAWLPELSDGGYEEYRDDRYVAAFDTYPGKNNSFAVAYILRAVTPGKYRAPAVEVEDMYKPELRARGPMGVMTIAAYKH
jgi:uncharacterized protein YfaS (alpha-2-macroglobulin family)